MSNNPSQPGETSLRAPEPSPFGRTVLGAAVLNGPVSPTKTGSAREPTATSPRKAGGVSPARVTLALPRPHTRASYAVLPSRTELARARANELASHAHIPRLVPTYLAPSQAPSRGPSRAPSRASPERSTRELRVSPVRLSRAALASGASFPDYSADFSPGTRDRQWERGSSRGEAPSRPQSRLLPEPPTLTRSRTLPDRFIPSRALTAHRLDSDAPAPARSALPSTHITARTTRIYKSTVAAACGLDVNQRILQFQPAPPERERISMGARTNGAPVDGRAAALALGVSQYENLTRGLAASRACYASGGPDGPGAPPSGRPRGLATTPSRVLDAPTLLDDFYLNLLAWLPLNLLAVALSRSLYVWNAASGAVALLTTTDATIASVRWSADGAYLSIGKENGQVEIWDIETKQRLRTLRAGAGADADGAGTGDNSRIGSQSWNAHTLSTGSRAGYLYHHDVRAANAVVTSRPHGSEVCGLEWRADGGALASGSNDNTVCIYDARAAAPTFRKTHRAAVKALAWCPEQTALLASGGGSTDKQIHFWNTTTGARVNTIDTGSQVSSLHWGYSRRGGHARGEPLGGLGPREYGYASNSGLEIMATHGYPDNSIAVYGYPSLIKTGEILRAHDARILHSAVAPDGATVVTSGDENLKFWQVWDKKAREQANGDGAMGKIR